MCYAISSAQFGTGMVVTKTILPSVIILHFSESLKRHLPGELENWKGL